MMSLKLENKYSMEKRREREKNNEEIERKTKRVRINCIARLNCLERKYRCTRDWGWILPWREFYLPIINFHIEIYQSVDSPRRGGSFGLPRFMRAPYDAAMASYRNDALAWKIIFRLPSIIARRAISNVVICRTDESEKLADILELNRLIVLSYCY